VPNPEETKQAPISQATATPTTTVPGVIDKPGADTGSQEKEQPTEPAKPTPVPTTVIPPKEEPTKAVPTPPANLKPTPVVVPTPPTNVIIDTGKDPPDGKTDGTNSVPPQPVQPNVGSNAGSPPNTSPKTGGGPSALPAWLALFSAVMVLGGWSMRRLGNPPTAPVPAEVERDSAEPQ
jgi:hypothetical protein